MRLISETIKTTPTYWLPVLTNISPPVLRRQHPLFKAWGDYELNKNLPIHHNIRNIRHKKD